MSDILIIGTGGLAREFISQFSGYAGAPTVLGFRSTDAFEHSRFGLPGFFVQGDVTPDGVGTDQVVIAIGNGTVRRRIHAELKSCGFAFPSLVHPTCVVSGKVSLGEGVVIAPQCVVSPDVVIGAFSYINFCCGIGHDVTIGSFVQINPGCQIGGAVAIGDESLIGSSSTRMQRIRVGSGATVASGSVVFAPVDAGATVLGNPAKRMRALEKDTEPS